MGNTHEQDGKANSTLAIKDSQLKQEHDGHCNHGDAAKSAEVKDAEALGRSLCRTLSEQEEYERQRAKKIVMDAIMTDQTKKALKDGGFVEQTGPDTGHHGNLNSRLHAGKGVMEQSGWADVEKKLKVQEILQNKESCDGKDSDVGVVRRRDVPQRSDEETGYK